MSAEHDQEMKRELEVALGLLVDAIELLDSCNAPPEVAAHVETAVYELRRALRATGSQPPG